MVVGETQAQLHTYGETAICELTIGETTIKNARMGNASGGATEQRAQLAVERGDTERAQF